VPLESSRHCGSRSREASAEPPSKLDQNAARGRRTRLAFINWQQAEMQICYGDCPRSLQADRGLLREVETHFIAAFLYALRTTSRFVSASSCSATFLLESAIVLDHARPPLHDPRQDWRAASSCAQHGEVSPRQAVAHLQAKNGTSFVALHRGVAAAQARSGVLLAC
jgi:hypothetical protein